MTAAPPQDRTDEAARIAAVRRYDILDTPPDGAFDRVAALAARICQVPISTISIVDEDRIWFKSAIGLPGVDQVDHEPGLCASAVLQEGPYVVSDAAIDPRTLANSLVTGELGLRFYVGVPLRTHDGHQLGTLNVIDREARTIGDDELATLEDLAAVVVDELELRLAARHTIELESLRAAADVRDAIVTGLSHDMRTPLTVLQGLSQTPVEELTAPDQAAELHGLFRRHVHRLSNLVEQFLDFASLEDGRAPMVSPAVTDVGTLVADAVDLHADDATFSFDPPAEPVHASIDPTHSLRIVAELLTNASRFSPREEPVHVEVRGVGDAVRVAVTDRGPGIEPEVQPHLFDKHYRAPGSSGRGLGLYVANALATAQGGRIEVDSSPGTGARFTLVLPRADGALPA